MGFARRWWERRWFAILLIVGIAIPLILPHTPPLVDVPGHMGRYRVELDLATSASLRRFYAVHWALAGNLGVDLLMMPLGRLLGLEAATKLIVIAIPMIGAVGLLWSAREVHGKLPPTAAAAIPFLVGLPFAFGFLNYCLSMGLAFCAFALWLRLRDRPATVPHALLFGGIALILWLCHLFGWAVFVVLVAGSEWPRRWDLPELISRALRLAPLALPLLPMILWHGTSHATTPLGWFDLPQKLFWLESSLRDRWQWPELALVGGAAGLLVYALASPRLSFDRRLVIPLVLLSLCFFILPNDQLLGSSHTDERLAPYLFAIALIAVRPAQAPGAALAATALFAGKVALFSASLWAASRDMQSAIAALDRVPAGARVASVVVQPCREWALPKLGHVGGMVLVRKSGFNNEQWIDGSNPLRTTPAYSGRMTRGWSEAARLPTCPGNLPLLADKLAAVPRDTFDYVWVIEGGVPPVPGATLVGLFGRTSLYRLPDQLPEKTGGRFSMNAATPSR